MNIEFNRGAVRPMDCYRTAWELIKPRYGLMLGICVVGSLIASAGPFGLLLGPMMCGILLCFLRLQRGEPIEFNTLFSGFDYFKPGFVVALIHIIPIMLVQIPYVIWIMYLTISQAMNAPRSSRGFDSNPMLTPIFFISMAVDLVLIMIVAGIMQGLLIFAYALVVDREMSGLDAVKTSIRAAFANLGGVAAIVVINIALSFAGLLLCYVGAILVIPLTLGVWAMAYRQVFPEPATGKTV